jgi:predicted  nucleic acid-binding Zn-ribbon protein
MDEMMKKILEIVTGTQDEVSEMHKEMSDVRRDINANTRAIADMAEQLRSVFGYAKEIDALMARVSVLEQKMEAAK